MLGVLAALEASVGGPEPSCAEKIKEHDHHLAKCVYFSSGSAICGLGVGLELLLGPMLSVLGRTWNLCWRSWAALGAYVGGLGPLLEPMWTVMGRSWSLCWRLWRVLGPKWSVLERDQGGQVALAWTGR